LSLSLVVVPLLLVVVLPLSMLLSM